MDQVNFFYEKQSPFDVPTTVGKLVEAAAALGWQNPATHNLQQSLAKAGKEVNPVQVVEICKPEFSGKLLELSDERIMSVLMPCRISVYEKADGKTYVAMLDMGIMAPSLEGHIAQAVNGAASESMAIIGSVVG